MSDLYADLPVARGPATGLAWGLGLLSALASVAAAASALAIQWHQIIAPLVTSAVALTLGFLIARFILGFVVESRRTLLAALTMIGFAPLLGSAASQAFSDSALGTTLSPARIAGVVALAIPCFVVVGAIARSLLRWQRRRLERVLSSGVVASVIGCLLLVGHAGLDALGVYSAVDPAPRQVASLAPAPLEDGSFLEEHPDRNDPVASPFALGRCCIGDVCFAYVRHRAAARVIGPRFPQDATLDLLHSDQRGELILMADGHMIAVAADDLVEGVWTAPTAATAARMHTPASFGALAIAALCGAALVLAWRYRLRRKLCVLAVARAGRLRENGWLELEGDAVPRRSLHEIEPGPVLLTDHGPRDTHAYRGDCGDGEVSIWCGTRQALTVALGDQIATANALILGWVVSLSAPLAVGTALALLG